MVYKWCYVFNVTCKGKGEIKLRFIAATYQAAVYKLSCWLDDNNLYDENYELLDNYKVFE